MMDRLNENKYKPNPKLAKALDVLFILHAEHEMNCSTAFVRHLASSGVDIYSCIAGSAAALYGKYKSKHLDSARFFIHFCLFFP